MPAITEEPELKNLTLEGVSLTLRDVTLSKPEDERTEETREKVVSMEQRMAELQLSIHNLSEMTNCLTSSSDA